MPGGLAAAGGARGGLAGLDDPGANTVATGDIQDNAVTDAKLRQSAGLSVLGRSAGTTGNVADITGATDGHCLRIAAGAIGWGPPLNTNVASNHVARGSGTGELTGDAELAYDATGKQFSVSAAVAGSIPTLALFHNSSAAAGSGARIKVSQAAGGTGDVQISLLKSGGTAWTLGIDTSAAGQFALNPADNTLGTGDVLQITTAGDTTLIGATFDQAFAASGAAVTSKTRNTSNTASATATYLVEVAGTTAADAAVQWSVSGTRQYTLGIDNSVAGDPLVLALGTALGTTDILYATADQNIGIGGVPSSTQLLYLLATTEKNVKFENTTANLYAAMSLASNNTTLTWYAFGGTYAGSPFFGEAGATSSQLTSDARLVIGTTTASVVKLATNNLVRVEIDTAGNVVMNLAALATTATDGFFYASGCAGTPTGVPTSKAGRAPLIVDTTNHKLYFYSGGAWRDAGP